MNKLAVVAVIIIVAAAGFAAGFYFPKGGVVEKTIPPPPTLKTGIYKLEGFNRADSAEPNYLGKVSIQKTGKVYKLQWAIGDVQNQRGVGILSGSTLSVGYVDISGGDINDTGVVSYLLIENGKLEGEWSSVLSNQTGREILTLEEER